MKKLVTSQANASRIASIAQTSWTARVTKSLLARDAFVRTNCRDIAVCLSGTGVHCDHSVVHVSVVVYGWIFQSSGHPDTKFCPPTPSRLFPVSPGREVGYVQTRRDISTTVEDRG